MMAIRRQQRHQRLWWLMGMACVIPLIDAFFAISSETLSGPVFDKMAFHLGRQCGALHFACVYSCIMVRLLIGTRSKIGKYILPALAGLILLAALCFLFFIKFADQESTEVLGLHIKGIAIRQCAQGVFSMMPTIGFVMILTPVLIPSVYIARIGELFSKDIQTGTQAFDEYLKFSRKDKKVRPKASFPIQHKTSLQVQKKPRMPFPAQNMNSDQSEDDPDERPDVLLVEDDLACAALVLKFCKKIKLECIHVESLDEAQQKFKSYLT